MCVESHVHKDNRRRLQAGHPARRTRPSRTPSSCQGQESRPIQTRNRQRRRQEAKDEERLPAPGHEPRGRFFQGQGEDEDEDEEKERG